MLAHGISALTALFTGRTLPYKRQIDRGPQLETGPAEPVEDRHDKTQT